MIPPGGTTTSVLVGGAAQELPDLTGELAGVDGLGEITVAPGAHAPLAVSLHRVGGDRDHRDVSQLGIRLELAGQLQAVDVGKLDVHQHQLRADRADGGPRRGGVGGGVDLVPALLQEPAEQFEVHLVVVHDEDHVLRHRRLHQLTAALCGKKTLSARTRLAALSPSFTTTACALSRSRAWSPAERSLTVQMITGVRRPASVLRKRSRNSNPSTPGITRSRTTAMRRDCAAASSAAPRRPGTTPARCSALSRAPLSIGLASTSLTVNPATAPSSATTVSTMTGMSALSVSLRIRASRSTPLMSGRIKSSVMASNRRSRSLARACAPVAADSTE